MSTPAQIAANQTNARLSTGPSTEAGKAVSCLNRLRHGLTGHFRVLPSEDESRYVTLLQDLRQEHQPATLTEEMLVEKMAQHYWIGQRAQTWADRYLEAGDEKQFALYLRYQTTHERALHKALNDLLKFRKEKRQAEIGFESQRRKQEQQAAGESRQQELHEARIRSLNAKSSHAELETELKSYIQAPLPGNQPIPYELMRDIFQNAAAEIHRQTREAQAAPQARASR